MSVQPQNEHKWLHKLIGNWNCEGEAEMAPGEPAMTWKSTESVRDLGGVWTLGEGRGEMPGGGQSITVMTLGYDPAKQRYVGTFVGSMMTNLWVYEGTLDPAGAALTLDTTGPSMASDGAITNYQDIVEFQSDDERTLTSRMQLPDGTWKVVMTARYKRQK
jgi:hypothetical protein